MNDGVSYMIGNLTGIEVNKAYDRNLRKELVGSKEARC